MSEKNGQKKILVADDSLTIQKVIRLALSGDGYEIQTVSDGKEALEQASLFRPDICIIDVSLPQFDAYQIREKFLTKPDLKNIPVILMSSAFEKVDEARAQKLGFAGHLIKPFDPSHLRSTLLSVATVTPQNDPVTATINDSFSDAFNAPASTARQNKNEESREDARLDAFAAHQNNTRTDSGFGSAQQNTNDPFDAPLIEPFSDAEVSPEPSLRLNPPTHQNLQSTPSAFMESKSSFDDFPALNASNPMDDIQQMARNTFEMSGLDQHDWGMIEPGKTSDPIEAPTHPTREVHSMDMPPSQHSSFQDPNDHFVPQPSFSAEEVEALVKAEVARALQQMQAQVQEQMAHEIRAIAHKLVPELAEKIIKEEIHKLLTDPPM